MLINKILLPVDGSDHAHRATDYVVELAGQGKIAVVLVHAYGDIPALLGSRSEIIEELKAESHKLLAGYADKLSKAGVSFTEKTVKGSPDVAILNTAKEEECDFIVLGARGHSELEGLILGSVSQVILQAAECPVLVVR